MVKFFQTFFQALFKRFQFSFAQHKWPIIISAKNQSKAVAIIFSILFLNFISLDSATAFNFQSSRTLGLAQTGRGGALLGDTITVNPSLLGFQPISAVSGTFQWLTDAHEMNVSVIDGKNQYAKAGVSYTRRSSTDLFHLGIAKDITSFMAFGISGKRFSTRQNAPVTKTGIDTGASVSFQGKAFEFPWQLGLVADNLVAKPDHEVFIGAREIGAGAKLTLNDILMVYADGVNHFSKKYGNYITYSGAVELALLGDFFARGGVIGFVERGWSAGIGWVGPRLGISYGYQSITDISKNRSFLHAVSMDLFI